MTISGGVTPYSYNWSSGQTSEDITNLSEDNFTVTITDANGCEIVSNLMEVNNNPGSFTLVEINTNNETCGDGTGSIDVILTGGINPISYNWSSGGFTQDLTNLSSGVYSCTTTDNNGCELNYSATILNNSGSMIVDNDTVTNETCSNNNGAINITLQGGTTPYSYSWNNGSTNEDLININAGNYNCIITDNAGCTVTYNTSVTNIGGDLQFSNITTTNEMCGNSNGEIDITVTGGTTPYSYLWSNGSTNEDLISLNDGTYSVTITDGFGCSETQAIDIIDHPGYLSIDNMIVTDEYCGNGLGQVDLTYSGGTEPVVITWNNGWTDEDLEDLSAGNYSVTIVDTEGCNVTQSVIVDNFTNGFEITASSVSDENCGDGLGAIDLTLTGGTTPYSYNWSNGLTTEDLSNLSEGIYTCTISDNTGCALVTTEQIVNVTNGLELLSTSSSNDYCYNSTGTVSIDVSGGISPYTYNWSNGATSEDLSNIPSGTYDVTISDNTGCMIYTSQTVQDDINNNLGYSSVIVTDDNCGLGNGIIDFDPLVSGTYVYELDGVPSGSAITQFSNLNAGTYIISILDLGCRVDSVVTLDNITSFTTTVDNISSDNCGDGNGSINISISPSSGTYSYVWSNNTYDQDLIGATAGIYTCTITDALGCQDFITEEVLNNASFTALANTVDEVCGNANGSIDITLTGTVGTVNYQWNTGITTEDLSGISAGIYTCTITDDNCTIFVTEEIINDIGTLTVISSPNDDFCNMSQGFIGLSVSGGSGSYSILWNTGATLDTLSNISAGNYNVTVTDDVSGCIFTDSYTIGNNGYFTVSESISHTSCQTCNDGAIDLIITGASPNYYFDWSNGATTEDISGVAEGTYTVTITDDWSCSTIETYVIGYNSIIVSATTSNDTCNYAIGNIFLTISSGSGDYAFAWNNGATSQNLTGIAAGTYDVTITDNIYGTIYTDSYIVNNVGGNYTVSSAITHSSCSTCNDGVVDLTVTGTGTYVFNWSNTETTEDISTLLPGIYDVTITDDIGCELIGSYEVLDANTLISATSVTGHDTCNQALGFIELTTAGGSGTYYYSWNTGDNTTNIYNLTAGSYSVTITDGVYFTTYTETFTINDNGGNYSASASITNSSCSTCNDGAIDLTITGIGTYTFLWSTTDVTEDISGLLPGIYTVTITDDFGCILIESFEVFDNATIITATATTGNDTCSQALGLIELIASGGSGTYSYNWSHGETTANIYNLLPGTYDVTITDNVYFTEYYNSYTITDNGGNYSLSAMINNSTCSTCNNGSIYLTVSGSGTYSFEWNTTETTQNIIDLIPGIYDVTVSDNFGCQLTESYEVLDSATAITATYVLGNDTCDQSLGFIELTVNGGSGSYYYAWSNGATTANIYGLVAGNYEVTATDAVYFTTYINNFNIINNGGNYTANSIITNSTCGTCADGAIDLTVTGTGIYTYLWSNGEVTEDIYGLLPDTYTITITDDYGCEQVETYIVFDATTVLSATYNIGNDSCNNAHGFIELMVTGGSGTYTYIWSNGANTANISGLTSGMYSVTVTDDINGTSYINSFDILNLGGSFMISSNVFNSSCASCNDGAINLTITGPGAYTYNWDTGATTEDISGLLPGIYYVTVTDDFLCLSIDSFEVFDATTVITATYNSGNDTCNMGLGYIELFVTGGSGTYSYEWSNTEITSAIYNLYAGSYTVTVTDDTYGTNYIETFNIISNGGSFNASYIVIASSCYTCADGYIDVTVNGTGTYSFIWDTGATTEDITNLLPGTYSLTITDDWGCDTIITDSVGIAVNIIETINADKVKVYPNPVNEILFIDYEFINLSDAKYKLYNMIGEVIHTRDIRQESGVIEINMRNYSSGIYYIEVNNGSSRTITKIVKGR